jgi:hypothetical protein
LYQNGWAKKCVKKPLSVTIEAAFTTTEEVFTTSTLLKAAFAMYLPMYYNLKLILQQLFVLEPSFLTTILSSFSYNSGFF